MKRQQVHAAVRTTILLGVLAVLLVVLQRQWKWYTDQLAMAKLEQSLKDNQTVTGRLDKLVEQRIATARSKAGEIAALRKQRSSAAAFAELTVPRVTSAWTRARLREEHLRYRLRELQAYRDLTRDPPPAKSAGEAFLERYLREAVSLGEEPVDSVQTLALGQAALDAGSRDPMIRLFYWVTHSRVHPDEELSIREMETAITELETASYPHVLEVYGWTHLAEITKGRGFTKETQQRQQRGELAIVRWLEEEHAHPEWQLPVYDRLWQIWRDLPLTSLPYLLTRLVESSNIDEYIIHLLTGELNSRQAWATRGTDFASNLNDIQRQGFQQKGKLASDHLQYAWFLRPDLPYAPGQMIRLEMGRLGAGETPHFWFLRTVEAQFDHLPAYRAMLVALQPEWGGSDDAMLQFAMNCITTGQFTTTVPYVALDALTTLQERRKIHLPQSPPAIALLRRLVADRDSYRESNPDAHLFEDNGRYSADLVALLEDSGQSALAAHVVRTAKFISKTRLQYDGRPGRYLISRLLAGTDESLKTLIPFDEKLRGPLKARVEEQQLADLAAEFQQLKEQAAGNDAAATYFDHVETILDQRRRFFEGQWVDLPIATGLRGWEPYFDAITVNDDDGVKLSEPELRSRRLGLRPLANFPPPFEIETTINVPLPAGLNVTGIAWARDGQVPQMPAGICPVMGIESDETGGPDETRRKIDFVRIAGLSKFSSDVENYDLRQWLGREEHHRLHLKLWDSAAEFWVDQSFWQSIPFSDPLEPQGYLYIGMQQFGALQTATVNIGHVRIRRLAMQVPPAATAPFEARLNYWEQRYQADHNDRVAVSRLCELRFNQKRFEDVITMANAFLKDSPETSHIRVWKARALHETYQDAAALSEIPAIYKEYDDEPEASILDAEILATTMDDSIRDGQKGLKRANAALQQFPHGKHARSLAALAAAHAEMGNFREAIRVHGLAMQAADQNEQARLSIRRSLYEAGQPYRHAPPKPDDPAR